MAGLKVLVLDQRPVAGGAAVTEEFSPGFRNSVASYAVSLLNPKIIRDLDLAAHGLRIVERPLSIRLAHPRHIESAMRRTVPNCSKPRRPCRQSSPQRQPRRWRARALGEYKALAG
jgi:phytoene dehydrogenase-like protein